MPWSKNVELAGYHDLGDRPGFKLAMQEINGSFFLYVASLWHSGWSILDVTEPTRPCYLRWLDGPANTWTIQVQVAEGRMVTALQHVPPSWSASADTTPPSDGLLIWDVSEPDNPVQLGHWASGATGTHRNFYNGGRYIHATTTLPGYDGFVYGVIDIDDPSAPVLRGAWSYPGQHTEAGEQYSQADLRAINFGLPYPSQAKPSHSLSLHGGAYVFEDRAYCPWMRGGLVILDVAAPTDPKQISRLPVYPPLGSSIALHTAVPLPGRDLVVVNSEALRESCDEPVNFAGIVDVRDVNDPILISLFPQPRVPPGYTSESFCSKGGRFGPHNQHQHQGQDCLWDSSDLIFMTYFNAGLQVFDIREPTDPHIVAYYVPDDPEVRRGPLPKSLVTQAEDVLVDRRGYVYMTEKNTGIYIMALT